MEKRKLENSDLEISVLTLGTWAYDKRNWRNVDENVAIKTIRKAIDLGINLVDTAPVYGDSEEIVGRAIKGRRDRAYLATKFGAPGEKKKIKEQLDESLSRLKTDYVDLYQLHYPPQQSSLIPEIMNTLLDLQKNGKIRYIGVSNFSVRQLKEALKVASVVSCQSPYNILWQEIRYTGILSFCRRHNIGILAYSPIAQGLLTGKFKKRADIPTQKGEVRTRNLLFKKGTFEKCLSVIESMRKLSPKYKRDLTQIALNWVIAQRGIASAIIGVKNLSQLEDNLKAYNWRLKEEDLLTLTGEGEKIASLFDYTTNMCGLKYPR
jgi:aryl-alcohol dehydrogenase-like predicted oxidoreductase